MINIKEKKLKICLAIEKQDIELVKQLLKEYDASWHEYEGTVHKNEVERANKQIENLCELFGLPDGCLFLAEYNKEAAGCVALAKLDNSICEMKRLYVKPEFRGFKIGRKLAESIVEQAKQVGYERMRIHTVTAFEQACNLYKSMGFFEIEPYEETPREDAVFMELKLI